jgi:hypothetical protein
MTPQLNTGNVRAPEAGLEPTTNRLTAESDANEFDSLQVDALGSPWVLNSTAQCARSLLDEITAGRWDVMLALQLASAVMNVPAVRLAAEVLTLGPHTVERTIELAELLTQPAVSTPQPKCRSRG